MSDTKPVNWSWQESSPDSVIWPPSSGSGTTVADSKSFARLSRSHWRDGIERHYPVGNAYGFTKLIREVTSVSGSALISRPAPYYKLVPFSISGTTGYTFSLPSYDASLLISEAKTNALGKFNAKANGDVSGIVMAGELGSTLRMFHPRCSSLIKLTTNYYHNFRRLYRSTRFGKGLKSDLNDLYLEWTYGMNPLMSDMEGLNETVQHIINKDEYRRDSGTDYAHDTFFTTPGVQTTSAGHFNFFFRTKVEVEVKCTIKGGRHIYADWQSNILAANFGFNLAAVPSALWELIPYSFVVDYVSNVGSLVSAISGTNQHHYYTTTSVLVKKKAEPVNHFGHCSHVGSRGQDVAFQIKGSTELVEFSRSLSLPGYSDLSLRFNLPDFKQNLNIASLIYAYKNRR